MDPIIYVHENCILVLSGQSILHKYLQEEMGLAAYLRLRAFFS